MGFLRAVIKFLALAVFSLLLLPFQALLLVFHQGRGARLLPYLWLCGVKFIFRIKVEREGTPYRASQTLYVSNHLSYLDIAVIGSLVKASFVARSDAASWPLLGWLAKLNQTAYVARSRSAAKKDTSAVSSVIDSGRSLIIFPEGTSTDGREILPFKSSLFSLALREDKPDLHLQPVTINVLSADERAMDSQEARDIYAWHRDMDDDIGIFDHWWAFAKHRGAVVRVVFHPAIKASDYNDRKILAKVCQDAVSNGVEKKDRIAA